MTALAFSPLFDLRRTYFLIGGVAGVSPKVATIGVSSWNVLYSLSLTTEVCNICPLRRFSWPTI